MYVLKMNNWNRMPDALKKLVFSHLGRLDARYRTFSRRDRQIITHWQIADISKCRFILSEVNKPQRKPGAN